MSGLAATAEMVTSELTIDIGGMPVMIRTGSAELAGILRHRYGRYLKQDAEPVFEFDVEAVEAGNVSDADDVRVHLDAGRWILERGDFYAEWDVRARRGIIRQSVNPYSIDCVLRIVHTLVLATEGGLLVHAASAVRNGRAFLFAGVSGAGKTTISRLAPADATLLTDEISYVRRSGGRSGTEAHNARPEAGEQSYIAYGTPFAGELAEPGENVRAPIGALYLLAQGPENRIEDVPGPEAVTELMASILFFAHDPDLVAAVFRTACDFVQRVPVKRLTFLPDERVWELIQ